MISNQWSFNFTLVQFAKVLIVAWLISAPETVCPLPNTKIEESYDEATANHNNHIYDDNCKICNKNLILKTGEVLKEQVCISHIGRWTSTLIKDIHMKNVSISK